MYLKKLFELTGKVAIVTVGGRGIGQVVALGLSQAGGRRMSTEPDRLAISSTA